MAILSESTGHEVRDERHATSSVSARWRGVLFLIAGAVRRLIDLVLEWRNRQYERAHLASLDERALRDIGVNRTEIWEEINKPFWKA